MNKRPSEGRSSAANIGFVDTGQKRSPAATKRHPHAIETIANLAFHTGYGATAWTALDSNLEMQAGELFRQRGDALPRKP